MKKTNYSGILLLLYMILPIGDKEISALTAQVLLSEIRAMYLAQQAEKKLLAEEPEGTDRDFLRSQWLDPHNNTANSYLSFLYCSPIFLNPHPKERITTDGFVLKGLAIPNGSIHFTVTAYSTFLVGLFSSRGRLVLDQRVQADETGNFEVQFANSNPIPGTRYRIRARMESEEFINETTQLTLIQN